MPIVFCAADTEYVAGRSLPSNVTGVDAKRDFARTLEVMQTIDPDLRHVTLVVGAGSMDRAWEAYPQSELQTHSSKVEFTWLRGLPLPELTRAVGSLPPGSAVLYLVQFADMYGTPYVPRAVAAAVSEAASAPVYGTWDTLIGSGITGGWLATMEEASIVAGSIAARVLTGSAPSTIRPQPWPSHLRRQATRAVEDLRTTVARRQPRSLL